MRNEFYYFEIKGPFRGFRVLQNNRFHVRFNFYAHFYVRVHVHPTFMQHVAMKYGHGAKLCSMDMPQGQLDMQHGQAAWTCSIDINPWTIGHAARTYRMEIKIKQGRAACALSETMKLAKVGIRILSPHLRNSAILRTTKSIAELRTKKSCRTAIADLQNLTSAIPQLSAVSCQFRYFLVPCPQLRMVLKINQKHL
jgi:hypothetical protein